MTRADLLYETAEDGDWDTVIAIGRLDLDGHAEFHARQAAKWRAKNPPKPRPWATRDGLREAIPPAYSRYIGGQLMAALKPALANVGKADD